MRTLFRNHYLIAFFATLIISVGMLITSIIIPPEGEIHPSVIRSVAELMFWPALAFAAKAIDEGKVARLSHGRTTVSIGDDDDNVPTRPYNPREPREIIEEEDIIDDPRSTFMEDFGDGDSAEDN